MNVIGFDFYPVLIFLLLVLLVLSYLFKMVAVWGGYVFVINLIGVHAAILVLLGRFGIKLYKAYSVFYFLGTFLATRVPVVGTTPLKSLEQLGPGLVFLGFQLLAFCEQQRKKKKMNRMEAWKFRIVVFAVAAIAGAVIAYLLDQYLGYFGMCTIAYILSFCTNVHPFTHFILYKSSFVFVFDL